MSLETQPPADLAEAYPLSPLQQGLLFNALDDRRSGVDIEQIFCDLDECLEVAVFERAWRKTAERHAVLRTRFLWSSGGGPLQIVESVPRVRVSLLRWESCPESERTEKFEAFLRADRRAGFDPSAPPLFRLALFQWGQDRFRFVFSFHHLLLDARALVVVLKEAFAFYDALMAGEDLFLPAPRPYRDYIDWLQTLDGAHTERFWRDQLAGFETPTPLPIADASMGGETDVKSLPQGERVLELSVDETARLQASARENRVTFNTLVQAAWAFLLARYSGEDDVVFGATRACRSIPVEGADAIVGLCVNTVPMRVQLTPDLTLSSWLQDLRARWRALRPHEHTPLSQIRRWSGVPADGPLFETMVNFQDPTWEATLQALGGRWADRRFGIRGQPNQPLVVDAYGGSALVIKLLYDRRRFSDEAITRLAVHYRAALEAMASAPNRRLGELSLLTARERRQILVEWNDTGADYPRATCVHRLFESRALAEPERIAVTDPLNGLSYGELNRRANRLAHRLKSLGVGPDVPVAVCMERSVAMVAAWLGVLKAGGAFVPLDPAYPRARLVFMLKNSRAKVLLVLEDAVSPSFVPDEGLEILNLDVDWDCLRKELKTDPEPTAGPSDLAYLIYTSGSTGNPKGVAVTHRSLVNLVTWHQRAYGVGPDDRAMQIASPSFDAAVWELWPYLAAGASVHLPEGEVRISPPKLLDWLAAERITFAFLPTPLAEAVLAEPWPDGLVLRALFTGGEKLNRRPREQPPCLFVNHYGPTETTVVATYARVEPGADNSPAPAIGRPIANTRVYVLDAWRHPVPPGVPGELFIGGDGVARGYLHQPGLTAEKFQPDLFSDDPKARLYRTGDLVRWSFTGELEFVGRMDDQVKIFGHRIEPGEIEIALLRHPSLRQAMVTVCEDARGRHLVACLVPLAEARAEVAELRRFLQQSLPGHMVPSRFIWFDQLPMTANGKVDRKSLPQLVDDVAQQPSRMVAPRTPVEKMLAVIWAEVLGGADLGVYDNFFELGGHSLLVAQVVARVGARLNVQLPLRALFEHPTVAALAAVLERSRREPRKSTEAIRRRTPHRVRANLPVKTTPQQAETGKLVTTDQ